MFLIMILVQLLVLLIRIMLDIQKIGDYSKILTDKAVKDFVLINFGQILNLQENILF